MTFLSIKVVFLDLNDSFRPKNVSFFVLLMKKCLEYFCLKIGLTLKKTCQQQNLTFKHFHSMSFKKILSAALVDVSISE